MGDAFRPVFAGLQRGVGSYRPPLQWACNRRSIYVDLSLNVQARTVKWTIGIIAAVILIGVSGVISLFVVAFISLQKGEEHRRQFQAELDSGRWDFGEQPALFAVAQGIVGNDSATIRAAAKGVPDLQAPGRDGATLLDFAVTQSWKRPELLEAVKTLLSLGADPNYTNGHRNSFAMANAVHSSAAVLRAMLEAHGNANTVDEFHRPIVLMNWYLGYYANQARTRLEPLLDHGVDVNSTMPNDGSDSAGYPLLLYRTAMGVKDNLAYSDALLLLQRGADPNRSAPDGMTFGKMLKDHRAHFQSTHRSAPTEFAALWDWAQQHGVVEHG